MANLITQILNPAWYHGTGKSAPFFEGWYYKLVNKAEDQRWAIIPGIFINEDPSKTHTFIQVLNGMTGEATYHRFGSFGAQPGTFDVRVDQSHFRADCLKLDVDDEIGTLKGELAFKGLQPWPVSPLSPGYMGPLAWLTFLECYHGVLSFDHEITGTLALYGQTIDFTGGRGYIEKDWGRSFPTAYIWQQTNHFDTEGTCLTGSIATLPALGQVRTGFCVGLWHDQQLYTFATYNRSQVDTLEVTDTHVTWVVYNRSHELVIHSTRAEGGLLMGPEREDMQKRVDETMQATVDVQLNKLDGSRKYTLYEGHGRNAALEVVGDISSLKS